MVEHKINRVTDGWQLLKRIQIGTNSRQAMIKIRRLSTILLTISEETRKKTNLMSHPTSRGMKTWRHCWKKWLMAHNVLNFLQFFSHSNRFFVCISCRQSTSLKSNNLNTPYAERVALKVGLHLWNCRYHTTILSVQSGKRLHKHENSAKRKFSFNLKSSKRMKTKKSSTQHMTRFRVAPCKVYIKSKGSLCSLAVKHENVQFCSNIEAMYTKWMKKITIINTRKRVLCTWNDEHTKNS